MSYEEHVAREEVSVLHPDPVVLELNRLQNLLAGSSSSSHIAFFFMEATPLLSFIFTR